MSLQQLKQDNEVFISKIKSDCNEKINNCERVYEKDREEMKN